jgi:pilus assembly protein Flp/PilA
LGHELKGRFYPAGIILMQIVLIGTPATCFASGCWAARRTMEFDPSFNQTRSEFGSYLLHELQSSRDPIVPSKCAPHEEKSMSNIHRFLRDEAGATAIEYGLIAAGIAVVIIAVVQGIGTNLNTTFTTVSTALK